MRFPAIFVLLALAAPAAGQQSVYPSDSAEPLVNVRVTTTILVVDREAITRAGLDYVLVGSEGVRVSRTVGARGHGGARLGVGVHGMTAFLEAARSSGWVRSESSQQVVTLSGRPTRVAAQELSAGAWASRTRGPTLTVVPRALEDGRVLVSVSARHEDSVQYAWGYGVDGSPAAVETEVLVSAGEEVVVATSAGVRSEREAGLLRFGSSERSRDVLVAVRAQVLP